MKKLFPWLIVLVMSTSACAAGSWTTNHFFYKPQLTTQGTTDYTNFNAALDATDIVMQNISGSAWIDYSSTSTIVGWGSFTTKVLKYKKVGTVVFVVYALLGVSNSTSTTFTLPFASVTDVEGMCNVVDNSGAGHLGISSVSGSIVTVFPTPDTVFWTASNNKVVRGQFFYEVAP